MQCVSSNGQFVFFLQGFSRNTHFKQMLLTFICNKLVKCVRNKFSMWNLFSCNASLHYLSKELKGHSHSQKVWSTFDCAIMIFLQKRLVIILSSCHTLKSRFEVRVARLRARFAILKRNTLHERIDKILLLPNLIYFHHELFDYENRNTSYIDYYIWIRYPCN